MHIPLVLLGIFPRACPRGSPAHPEEVPSLPPRAEVNISSSNDPGLLLLSHYIPYASHMSVSYSWEPLQSIPSAVGGTMEAANIYSIGMNTSFRLLNLFNWLPFFTLKTCSSLPLTLLILLLGSHSSTFSFLRMCLYALPTIFVPLGLSLFFAT